MKKKLFKAMTLLIAGCISLTSIGGAAAYADSQDNAAQDTVVITTVDEDAPVENHVFPSEENVKDYLGYLPNYLKEFKNGYKFESYNLYNQYEEENGEIIYQKKGIEFHYKKDDKGINILVNKTDDSEVDIKDEIISLLKIELSKNGGSIFSYKGAVVMTTVSEYRMVKEGYTPTQEEQEKIDNGSLFLVPGDEEKSSTIVNTMIFQGDMLYTLISIDDGVTTQDTISMAKEILDK